VRAVLVEVPERMLAERRRLGHDRFDEMWEGELHMVPPPSGERQRFGSRLLVTLAPVAEASGLLVTYETGLFDPGVAGSDSYRQPDLAVYDPAVASERGVEGAARLVVEIRSPGDETFEKIPFYSRVGVAEMVVVDRDTKDVRRWSASGGSGLAEVADEDGWHVLDALDVALRGVDGRLMVRVAGEVAQV
jgi:Uma2 family endonuclease